MQQWKKRGSFRHVTNNGLMKRVNITTCLGKQVSLHLPFFNIEDVVLWQSCSYAFDFLEFCIFLVICDHYEEPRENS